MSLTAVAPFVPQSSNPAKDDFWPVVRDIVNEKSYVITSVSPPPAILVLDVTPHWQLWLQKTADRGNSVTARPPVVSVSKLVVWKSQVSEFSSKTSIASNLELSSGCRWPPRAKTFPPIFTIWWFNLGIFKELPISLERLVIGSKTSSLVVLESEYPPVTRISKLLIVEGLEIIAHACCVRGYNRDPTSSTVSSAMLIFRTVDWIWLFEVFLPPNTKKESIATLTTHASLIEGSKWFQDPSQVRLSDLVFHFPNTSLPVSIITLVFLSPPRSTKLFPWTKLIWPMGALSPVVLVCSQGLARRPPRAARRLWYHQAPLLWIELEITKKLSRRFTECPRKLNFGTLATIWLHFWSCPKTSRFPVLDTIRAMLSLQTNCSGRFGS